LTLITFWERKAPAPAVKAESESERKEGYDVTFFDNVGSPCLANAVNILNKFRNSLENISE
jgi:hypothetical protein